MAIKKDKLLAGAEQSRGQLDRKGLDGKTYIENLSVDDIAPNPYQPRKSFDNESLENLAESIKKEGQVSLPIEVVKKGNKYTLIAGERRLRASKMAGMKKIRAIVTLADDKKMRRRALEENLLRDDLTTKEKFECMLEIKREEGITSNKELASVVNMSSANTYLIMSLENVGKNLYDLYSNTHPVVPTRVMEKLSGIENEEKAIEYFKYIVKHRLSRDNAIEYIASCENAQNNKKPKREKTDVLRNEWGQFKKSKKKFVLEVNREGLSSEKSKLVETKLNELEELLKTKD